MRVVFWIRQHFAREQLLAALSELPIELRAIDDLDGVLAELDAADMLITSDCAPGQAARLAPAIATSPVRYLQFLSAGRERLTAAGLPDRIALFGIGDALAPAIGEHGMALALALYRGLPQTILAGVDGDWGRAHKIDRRALEGDVALIVGLGAIGRDLARRANAFGMRVLAVTRSPLPNRDCDDVRPLSALDDLLQRAGVVFLSIALAPETRHLINAARIACMRRGAFLVNVARGGLVDQPALIAALNSGALGGAGFDVTDPEPLPSDNPLWYIPNVIITPHVAVAGSTLSADRLAAHVASNVTAIAQRHGRGND